MKFEKKHHGTEDKGQSELNLIQLPLVYEKSDTVLLVLIMAGLRVVR